MTLFFNREEAGQKLGQKLRQSFPKINEGIVLALPRGGVVIGEEIAKSLNLPLDIIVTRKIGAPQNPEYAVAAVGLHARVINPREETSPSYLEVETKKARQEINRRLRAYRGNRPYHDFKGKTVILVDDGLATGLSMKVAIEEVKLMQPVQIILASPVAPPETISQLRPLVDRIVVLLAENLFFAVGQFYRQFEQVEDDEVQKILKRARR